MNKDIIKKLDDYFKDNMIMSRNQWKVLRGWI